MKKQLFYSIVWIFAAMVLVSCGHSIKSTEEENQKEIVVDISKLIDNGCDLCGDCEDCDYCDKQNCETFRANLDNLLLFLKHHSQKQASDVERFLDSISDLTGIPVHMKYEDCNELLIVERAVHELRRYQTGERHYYPEMEVKEALDCMAFELGYEYSHAVLDLYGCLFYWYNFATQAALLCPNVEFVSHLHSADHQIGLLSYHEWSPSPLMSFLVSQKEGYCTIQLVDNDVNLKKIFQIRDNRGNDYYLLSSEYQYNKYDNSFDAYLFRKEDDQLLLVTKTHESFLYYVLGNEYDYVDEGAEIRFNPNRCQWDLCIKKGEYWHKIEGTKSLYLHIDEKEPYFEIQ